MQENQLKYRSIEKCKQYRVALQPYFRNRRGGDIIAAHTGDEKRVYEVEEIQEILHIGRTKVYEFIKAVYREQKPFKVIKIGNIYRIPKASFDKWLDEDKQLEIDYLDNHRHLLTRPEDLWQGAYMTKCAYRHLPFIRRYYNEAANKGERNNLL